MGNSGSINLLPGKKVLELSEESANPPPITDEVPPADGDIHQALAALGVDASGMNSSGKNVDEIT